MASSNEPSTESVDRRFREVIVAPVGHLAWAVGLLFWWMSLSPTLMPRAGWAQGVISGLSLVVGIAIGSLIAWIGSLLWRLIGRRSPALPRPWGFRLLAVATAVEVPLGLLHWENMQMSQRWLLTMEPLPASTLVYVVIVTLVIAMILFVIGRVIAQGVRRIDRETVKFVPRWASIAITVVIVATVASIFSQRVVWSTFVSWANTTYSTVDDGTPPGIVQPATPTRSGSPGSLTPWNTLGYEGRNFAGGGPTVTQLQEFIGARATAIEPVRVYVGLDQSSDPATQARIAVEELERAGGFRRSVLAIATVTGTGWVDPGFAAGLEYMNHGDTAIVAMQYSYLPSWISFLVDLDKAAASGRAINDAVIAKWRTLPTDTRPRLVTFGISLGSYGSEEAFASTSAPASVDSALSQADAVLWAGPTFANTIWHQIIAARDPGAPVWHPTFRDGAQVSIMGAPDQQSVPSRLIGRHIVYLTHPSDPVTWASVSSLWSEPAWMRRPQGYDVPTDVRWFPFVTFSQELFDLMAGFSAPPGYGHNYQTNMANGLVAIAAPPGWTAQDTAALDARINTLS